MAETRMAFRGLKRERSRRMVKLQNWVTDLLRRLEEKARTAGAKPGDLVFTSQLGGPIRETKFVERYLKPLLESAGLPTFIVHYLKRRPATKSFRGTLSELVFSPK